MSVKHLNFIFDFDGTLVLTNEIKLSCYYETIENFKISTQTLEFVLRKSLNKDWDRYRIFKEIGILSGQDIEKMCEHYTKLTNEKILKAKFRDGAFSILNKVKGALFINSATPEKTLKSLVIKKFKDITFTEVKGKPNKKIQNLNMWVHRYNLDKESIVVIGDGADDEQYALEAGVKFYGLDGGTYEGQSKKNIFWTFPEIETQLLTERNNF